MESFQYINSNFDGFQGQLLYRVNRAGVSKVERDFDISRNSSYPYCTLHYIESGAAEVLYKDRKYHVNAGQCFILNPFKAHRYYAATDVCELYWIEFGGGDCAKLIGACLDVHTPVMEEIRSKMILWHLMRILKRLKNGSNACDIENSKNIYMILMCLMEECRDRRRGTIPESREYMIQKVKYYISGNLNEKLTMEQLSKVINYNAQYFNRLFQKSEGITLAKYILSAKINAAKGRLVNSGIKIEVLAEQLGFCNTSHFIREFKKAEGLTPAEFRKESISYCKK